MTSTCSVSTCIQHQTAVTVSTSTWTDTAMLSRWQLYWKRGQWKKGLLSFVFYRHREFHLLKFIVSGWQCMVVMWWQYIMCVNGAWSGRVNTKDEKGSGRPSTFANPIQNIDATEEVEGWVLLNWNGGLIFPEAPFGTLFMKVSATGKFSPRGFVVIWRTQADKRGVMLLPHYEEHGKACNAEMLQKMRFESSTTP